MARGQGLQHSVCAIDVYIDKKVKAIAPYPLIAQQEKGDSDIVGSAIDYDDLFKKTNSVFSSIMR